MNSTISSSTPSPTHEQIAIRAHALWEASGCPDGRDLGFWLEAERELMTALPPPATPAIPRRRGTKARDVDGLGEKTEEMLDHTGTPGTYSPTSLGEITRQ